ncbi:hypothetical protein HG536_0D01980 [Torulaspora globosa]|uniref:Zn(2)-C6 fungal-type domain-containing protein n=1 Tax=Torulaspora globosa TaxID=48254 RepID=A0A7G3ZGP0_9SACH|nr:uncharacterized protein HG536_0D01980 [Torulaspora globosa]QLL32676.1 hypothetical protein HG536_0D01980 [Torulaspora globosa]
MSGGEKTETVLRGRTFTGCWACRFKKRRCDELKPRCSLCVKHNDSCCYDVRLIWLDENIYKRAGRRSNKLESLATLRSDTRKKRKISKQRFKALTQYRALSPPNSDCESECGSDDQCTIKQELEVSLEEEPLRQGRKRTRASDDSFTISIRRLKIYDNAVASVYGSSKNRRYDQKHVNEVLTELLNKLEPSDGKNVCCTEERQGPFGKFSARCESKGLNLPSPNSHHQHGSESSQESQRRKLYIDSLVENKIYTLLWLNTHGNMILSRLEYCNWFLAYMKRTLPFGFCQVLEKIIDDANPFNIASWIQKIKSKWQNNPDWQAIAFTILTVVHGYTCPELARELERWFQTQKTVSYSMFPLINFIVRNTTDLSVLHHCYELLNNNDENVRETYKAELTYELHVLVAGNLVNRWRDRILEQLCLCEDTTHSCSQLKFWELQLKYNEKFYRDVYTS